MIPRCKLTYIPLNRPCKSCRRYRNRPLNKINFPSYGGLFGRLYSIWNYKNLAFYQRKCLRICKIIKREIYYLLWICVKLLRNGINRLTFFNLMSNSRYGKDLKLISHRYIISCQIICPFYCFLRDSEFLGDCRNCVSFFHSVGNNFVSWLLRNIGPKNILAYDY